MENIDPLATGLLVVIIALIIALAIIFSLAAKISKQRDEHTRSITELQQDLNSLQMNIQNKAQELYQTWAQRDSDTIRANEREIASREALTRLEQWKYESEIAIRNDAIQRSHSVILGKVTEHLVPYMPDFPFNPRMFGLLAAQLIFVFDGMDEGDLRQVVFVEVKTGASAALTKLERRIRDVISAGNVKWVEMRIPRVGELITSAPTQASSEAEFDAQIKQEEDRVKELEQRIVDIATEFALALQDTFERNRNIGDFVFEQLPAFQGTRDSELLIRQAASAWSDGNDEMALQMLRKALESDTSLVPFIKDLLFTEE